MPERWSVEISRHTPRTESSYEDTTQDMKIFLNEKQAEMVREAVLATLASNMVSIKIATAGVTQ